MKKMDFYKNINTGEVVSEEKLNEIEVATYGAEYDKGQGVLVYELKEERKFTRQQYINYRKWFEFKDFMENWQEC